MADELFKFEQLDVWQRAADLAIATSEFANDLTEQHLYRFAEQVRAASLSISNNIAEGSGSNSNNDFRNFLNMARPSAFECASMLLIFKRQSLISLDKVSSLLSELNQICRMITGLHRSLG